MHRFVGELSKRERARANRASVVGCVDDSHHMHAPWPAGGERCRGLLLGGNVLGPRACMQLLALASTARSPASEVNSAAHDSRHVRARGRA